MDHFHYKDNILHAEDVSIIDIAKEVGTPFYCYSTATLTRHYKVFYESFKAADPIICFSVKSNPNIAVLKTLAELGSGGDCVSEGEIRRCLKAGIPSKKIIFSGVGKTKDEMRFALENEILQLNVESFEELYTLNEVAKELGKKAPIAFRINPNVEAKTHEKISTGRKQDKFGIEWESAKLAYEEASKLSNIKIQGITTHIGSQLTDLNPFKTAFAKIVGLVKELKAKGHDIAFLDLGGGLGIPYNNELPPSPSEYADMVIETTKELGCKLCFEPGRVISGNAGILVSEVLYLKNTSDKKFLIIDAAMNDLIRPSMYDAHHEFVTVNQPKANDETINVDIVGPVCESSDRFAKDRNIPAINPGDLVAIRSSGAYGASMSSTYNSRRLIAEVMVKDNKFSIIRKRQSYDEMFNNDSIPQWFQLVALGCNSKTIPQK